MNSYDTMKNNRTLNKDLVYKAELPVSSHRPSEMFLGDVFPSMSMFCGAAPAWCDPIFSPNIVSTLKGSYGRC